jgi:hypothetical protein
MLAHTDAGIVSLCDYIRQAVVEDEFDFDVGTGACITG